MATRAPTQQISRSVGGSGRGGVSSGNAGGNSLELADTGHSEIAVLAGVLAMVALCLCIGLTMVAYIETMWMKAEIKQEAKELRKLKQEIKESK